MKKVLYVMLIVCCLAVSGFRQANGNAQEGKRLFMKHNCYYCHGTSGQGGRDGVLVAILIPGQVQEEAWPLRRDRPQSRRGRHRLRSHTGHQAGPYRHSCTTSNLAAASISRYSP